MDKDKVAWAEAKILPTTRGKDALTIIKSNVKIGASLRGFGEIDSSGKVKPGLEVRAVDLVVDPSFGADATITQKNVYEAFTPESAETDSGEEENSNPQGNKPEDANKDGEKMSDKIKTSEELKKEYPELTKALEDAAVEANKVDVEKIVTEKIDAAKEAWKKDITADLEEKLTTVSTKIEKIFEIERKHVADLCEIEGFIEDETDEEKAEREKKEKDSTSDSKLGKKVEDLETKNTALEKKIKDKEDADKKDVEDTKTQKKVREALDTELEKKDNKQYKDLIEGELVDKEGKVLIEKEDEVEAAVKGAREKLSEIFTKAKKHKIIEGDLKEIGKVEDPEGKPEVDEALETKRAHYREAVVAGEKKTFKEWLKEKSERE